MKYILSLAFLFLFAHKGASAQSFKDSIQVGSMSYYLVEEDWPIVNDYGFTDNTKAKEYLKQDVFIEHIKTGKVSNIHDLKNKIILFITYWDTASAFTIGYLKKKLDKGENIDIAFVYFENEKQKIIDIDSDSWFFDYCYVLNRKSKSLKKMIVNVPIVLKPQNSKE